LYLYDGQRSLDTLFVLVLLLVLLVEGLPEQGTGDA